MTIIINCVQGFTPRCSSIGGACTAMKIEWTSPIKFNEFYMMDPNFTTGLKFHKNISPGDHYFCGIVVPWTKFFRTKIPLTGTY